MSKSDLTVGCIGAGYFSQFHYDAWARIPGAIAVASVDQDIEKAKATGLCAFDDAGRMLEEVQPDIVDIVTPPGTHLDLIRQALEVRPKAIICQKPFCRDVSEAESVAQISNTAGIPVVVHENFRFQPWYRTIKAALIDGMIGDVLQLTFRFRPGDGQGARAYLDRQPYFQHMPRFLVHETAVHWVDTFRFLMGEPQAVIADLRRMNPVIKGEDAGYILFSYQGGRRALFDANRLLDHSADNTRCTMGEALIEGTEGSIELLGDGSVRLRRFGETSHQQLLGPHGSDTFGGDCVHALQSHVVEALKKNVPLENTASDYLPVLVQEQAIYTASEKGCWVQL
ncbi:MAG: Gfo/Idh/MocA family oxidoreductase [Silicimonas sp.]|nr:Gfo/Idh/MocA family oxidoreductase [Silicimonas sp.]